MIGDRLPDRVRDDYHQLIDAAVSWMGSGVTNTYRMPLWKSEDRGIYLWWGNELLWMTPMFTEGLGKPTLETFLQEHELRAMGNCPRAVRVTSAICTLRSALLTDMARHKPYVLGETVEKAPVILP